MYYKQLLISNIWGLGIGDWGLGIGPIPHSPIPNPQSPIPNPQSPVGNIIFRKKRSYIYYYRNIKNKNIIRK